MSRKNKLAQLSIGSLLCGALCTGGSPALESARGASQVAPPRAPRRLALLVGVGRYYQRSPRPGHSPWPELHTETEIHEYRQVLTQDYGFAESDIVTLLDEKATKDAIRQAFLQHLVAIARPGDVVLFHFSGHGQRLPDDPDPSRQDEPDGLDESLVPYDALDQSIQEGLAKNILDDELGAWLEKLAARMRPRDGERIQSNITVTLDACFSGSAARGRLIARGRVWDEFQDGPLPPRRPDLPAEEGAGILAATDLARRDLTVVAAARADQTAWEHNGQGVFTRYWVRHLARLNRASMPTYQTSVDRLAIDLAAEGLAQEPQVTGAADKQIFSVEATRATTTQRTFRVLGGPDPALQLQAGEVHGVTLRSVYELHAAGTSALGANSRMGEAEVVDVTPFAARLQPLPTTRLRPEKGALAIEIRHAYSLAPLRTLLLGFGHQPTLIAQVARARTVQLVGQEDSRVAPRIDHDVALQYIDQNGPPRVVLLGADGLPRRDPVPLGDGFVERLEQRLVEEWRRKHFTSLRNDNPDARVDLEIVATEPVLGPARQLLGARHIISNLPRTAHSTLPYGTAFGLRLHNRSPRDLFAAVVAISPDGDIDLLFGKEPGENRIPAGKTAEPPLSQTLFLLSGKRGERVVIKVIATETFVDFSGIESTPEVPSARSARALRSTAPTYAPLQQLLAGLGAGVRSGGPLLGTVGWGTTDGSILIR